MRHDGTQKIVKKVKDALAGFGSINVTKSLLEEANTTYEKVYQALGGKAAGIDVWQQDQSNIRFSEGCGHTEVLEEYRRLGPTRYKVTQTCTRCGEGVAEFTRVGGEMAERKIVHREGHLLKDEPYDHKNPGGGEGYDDELPEGDDPGELPPEEEESKGDGGGKDEGTPSGGDGEDEGEGEGEGEEGGGEGDGEDEGDGDDEGGTDGEGEGGGEGNAEDGEGEAGGEGEGGEGGEGEGEGGGDEEGEGDGECEEGEGGKGGEGEDGDGDADAPPPSYMEAFKKHWDGFLSDEQRAMIYRRISLMMDDEESNPLAEAGDPFGGGAPNTSLKVKKEPGKYGKTKVESS